MNHALEHSETMKIGIDISTWHNGRGFGRFTREIVAALLRQGASHEFVLFGDSATTAASDFEGVREVLVKTNNKVTESAISDDSRSLLDVFSFSKEVYKAKLDVMYYPAVYSWFPAPPGLPVILTVHDAIAEHYPELVFPRWRNRIMWGLKMRLALMQADRLITVSEAARREIHEHLGVSLNLIDLATEGPNTIFTPPVDSAQRELERTRVASAFDLKPGASLLAYVGGFAPHKNLHGLLRAFERLASDETFSTVRLLMVGDYGGHGFHSNFADLKAYVDGSALLAERVLFTGFVEDDLLAAIYRASVAVVFPSFSEGFGLPAVEAMACGTPVLASNRASLPEVVGDAGILFDPNDIESIRFAMASVLDSEVTLVELRKKAELQASKFTWEAAAAGVMGSIERCLTH